MRVEIYNIHTDDILLTYDKETKELSFSAKQRYKQRFDRLREQGIRIPAALIRRRIFRQPVVKLDEDGPELFYRAFKEAFVPKLNGHGVCWAVREIKDQDTNGH